MIRYAALLMVILLLAGAGCLAPQKESGSPAHTVLPSATAPLTTIIPTPATPVPTSSLPPVITTASSTRQTPVRTPTITPAPAGISESALNARIVDARNRLDSLIESDMADTVLIRADGTQSCEVKKSKELGYLINTRTGESTFVKGDYWSIDADLFTNRMNKDDEYIIIHTHPRMWTTCGNTGITSLFTFSLGDLYATANLTERGYHVRTLIAIADKEYRIWPEVPGAWKSRQEIRQAVYQVERRLGASFTYHDTLLDLEFTDVDNLMPLLAKELDYHYSANSAVIA